MSYYVYILKCLNGALYTGITTDLKKRFARHKKGKGGRYTRANPPKEIRYFEKQPNRSLATKREMEIKRWSGAKKLALIKKDMPAPKLAAKRKKQVKFH